METKPDPYKSLKEASHYRAFLQAYLDWRKISRSVFAKQSGFVRGFPGDVIGGRRRLTLKSYAAFENALKLPASGKKLFKTLVALEEPGLFPEMQKINLPLALLELRSKQWDRQGVKKSGVISISLQQTLKNPDCILIFAAAGSPSKGALIKDISKRTNLSLERILPMICEMEQVGLVRIEDEFILPSELHMLVEKENLEEVLIQAFVHCCDRASNRIYGHVNSADEMFFTSTVCIEKSKLPLLKIELKKIILQFVGEAISEEGDGMVRILAAMTQ